jgi:hypothetical protein
MRLAGTALLVADTPPILAPRAIDDVPAGALGTPNFELRLRPISMQTSAKTTPLETDAQKQVDNFERSLTLTQAGKAVTLKWKKDQPVPVSALAEVYRLRTTATGITGVKDVGYKPATAHETAALLPHLYQFVLPIKMGDCLNELSQYEQAQEEYLRASRFGQINAALEAPDLWRRLAENIAEWGDSRYREEETNQALPVYQLLMTEAGLASTSVLYTTPSLLPTGQKVAAWLKALADGTPLPELNPAIAQVLHGVRKRWFYITAGLDFFGSLTGVVPPFSFRYLQEVARYFAERAIQGE